MNYPKRDLRDYLSTQAIKIIKNYHQPHSDGEEEDLHVYDFIPNHDVDYPFIVIGEMFEKPYNDNTRTVVKEDTIIHIFNYHEKIRETEDITYLFTKALYENLNEAYYGWSILEGYTADSLYEYDDKKNDILSHVVIDMSFVNK